MCYTHTYNIISTYLYIHTQVSLDDYMLLWRFQPSFACQNKRRYREAWYHYYICFLLFKIIPKRSECAGHLQPHQKLHFCYSSSPFKKKKGISTKANAVVSCMGIQTAQQLCKNTEEYLNQAILECQFGAFFNLLA